MGKKTLKSQFYTPVGVGLQGRALLDEVVKLLVFGVDYFMQILEPYTISPGARNAPVHPPTLLQDPYGDN